MASVPRFIILGGPNGSGKSTIAPGLVRDVWGIKRFLNADTIARGLAGFDPDMAMVAAGRVLLSEAKRHIASRTDFAVETTLSGSTYARWLRRDMAGWRTHLAFVYTRSVEENVIRVRKRVLVGGHDVPEVDIRRRYDRSLGNFFGLYRPLVGSWEMIDNTENEQAIVAERPIDGSLIVTNRVEWMRLEATYGKG